MFSIQGPLCYQEEGVYYWFELNIRSLFLTDNTISQRFWSMFVCFLFFVPLSYFVHSSKSPGSKVIYLL